jgi:hypothetical protein
MDGWKKLHDHNVQVLTPYFHPDTGRILIITYFISQVYKHLENMAIVANYQKNLKYSTHSTCTEEKGPEIFSKF